MEGHTKDFGLIGWAVKQMHNGSYAKRRAWKNVEWVAYVPPGAVQIPHKFAAGNDTGPFLVAKVAAGLVAWQPTQADLLAVDWQVVAEPASEDRGETSLTKQTS